MLNRSTKWQENQYLDMLYYIVNQGYEQKDRTGIGTKSVNGHMMTFDLTDGFPAVTTKQLAWKSVVGELLWFLEGSTSDRRLAEITYGDGDKKTIWTANWEAKPYRSPTTSKETASNFNGQRLLGPVYGAQWCSWGRHDRKWSGGKSNKIDQIREVIESIKTNPASRRHIVSAWNPTDIPQMSLPPCHILFQFFVQGEFLDMTMYQRSADMFLGVPFNIASYSLLLHIVAAECNLTPRSFTHFIGDAHVYLNHIDQVNEQINREPYEMPTLQFEKKPLFDEDGNIAYTVDDFKLVNYQHHPKLTAPMAV